MNILIVDTNQLIADALRLFLENEVDAVQRVSVAADASSALDRIRSDHPDIVLLDIGLKEESGYALGQLILDQDPNMKIIALTEFGKSTRDRALRLSKFHGNLTKEASIDQLLKAIRGALDGKSCVSFPAPARSRRPSDDVYAALLSDHLTKREKEVLGFLVEGLPGQRIAEELHVAPNTVRTHIQNVLVKLQVHSRLEAVAFAVRHGMVDRHAAEIVS